jgi:hypothetical protein
VTVQVVLVRPWTDAHGGTGCCGGDVRDGICLDGRVGGVRTHDVETQLVAETYLRLSQDLPEVDVQIVGAGNTAYLLPAVFRAIRARHGTLAALRGLNRATTAGSVLVDGEPVGQVGALGVEGALREVHRRCPAW